MSEEPDPVGDLGSGCGCLIVIVFVIIGIVMLAAGWGFAVRAYHWAAGG